MNLDYMREFVMLAGCLNYTTTAQKLHISQPALTRHIHSIEKDIGVPLLIRSTHNVELTPFGETVREGYTDILARYDNLTEQLKIMNNGYVNKLCFGVLYYGIGMNYAEAIIKAFRQKADTTLSIVPCQPNKILQKLTDRSIDICLKIHSKFTSSDDFVFVPICRERLYALVTPAHPLAAKKLISLEALSAERIIFMQMDDEHETHVRTLLKYHDLDIKNILYTEYIDMLPITMEETNGIFIGTRQFTRLRKNFVSVDIDADDFYIDICLVYRSDNLNPAVSEMLSCLDSLNISDTAAYW
ncbi:MAG: LysR family transcriptional regulator [Syntrophomonadaceae bacterium]|jgi:DNA-binding transcriptional LysR family regulator|nr:LysR family transcriptional regulator [Syntrophomonadaceae bacterium]